VNPDICFHLAALSRPDLCQKNQKLANDINLLGTRNVVESLPKSCQLFFGSTDLVFDGQNGWYKENDSPHPINHYAWTKCEAEKIVRGFQGAYCIVRLSLMFGLGDMAHQSASDWMLRSLMHHKPVSLFIDQFRTMIYVEHVCQILKTVIQSGIKGILHVGGSDRISRYHFGILLCTQMGLPHELLRPIKMEEIQGDAKRGSDCSLSTQAMIQNLGIQPPGILEGIVGMRNALIYLDDK
jgi:dTDP-4-dehydrorhamnose reductase